MLPGAGAAGGVGGAFSSSRASYVALSAVTTLGIALLASLWPAAGDVSGSISLLGLVSIYLASQELLAMYVVFCPASILVDLMRGLGGPKDASGRGWLILLQLLGIAAKSAGTVFAVSLWRSVASGEALAASSYAAPQPGVVGIAPAYSSGGSSYQRVRDPFADALPHMASQPHGSGAAPGGYAPPPPGGSGAAPAPAQHAAPSPPPVAAPVPAPQPATHDIL